MLFYEADFKLPSWFTWTDCSHFEKENSDFVETFHSFLFFFFSLLSDVQALNQRKLHILDKDGIIGWI